MLEHDMSHAFVGSSTGLYVARGVGIATGWKARVRFPAWAIFSLLHSVQTGYGGKAAGA
jgi:hypothetical protein